MASMTEVILFFLRSDNDIRLLTQVITETLLQQPGCLRVRCGSLHENAKKAQCFVEWANISRCQHFKAASSYTQFLEKLEPLLQSPPDFHLVRFQSTVSSALDEEKTPVIEVLSMYYPSEDNSTSDIIDKARTNAIQVMGESAPLAKGSTGVTALGWIVGNVDFKGEPCRASVTLIGWESVEAHHLFRDTEAFEKGITLLKQTPGLKGVSVVYVLTATTGKSE
ncbi:hypothetical protein SCARD494_01890 [Seiridium cardinale]